MTTWAEFKANVVTVLGDENRAEPTWSDAELLLYMNYALSGISEHTAQEKEAVAVLAAATTTYALPADCLGLGPVRVTADGVEAGRSWTAPASAVTARGGPSYFYEWKGTLYFLSAIPSGATLSVAYYGYWDRLTADANLLGVPQWMEEALLWAVMRHCMSKPGVQSAQIRPWNTRQDSGTPEDNPALIFAEYCRKQYERILANHPNQDRTGWESK
jgi:hypothetical protein